MDALHTPQATMFGPQVKTWNELAQSAYAAYYKEAGDRDEEGLALHALHWAELDAGTQACWERVVHQLWAEYVVLNRLAHQQFRAPSDDSEGGAL